jgi:chromosomal replication initiation ATPase DnaA
MALPDLASRLRAARPVRLLPPDDAFLRQVLVKLFADRQLFVSPPLLEYLERRMERSFAAAAALVRRMDEAALARGKPLSRQLAAEILAEFVAGDDETPDRSEAK